MIPAVFAKFLKGVEENQVEWNVLIAMIAAAHPSTDGTQCTGDAQTTYCPDRKVILQRHNRRHALRCRMDEEG